MVQMENFSEYFGQIQCCFTVFIKYQAAKVECTTLEFAGVPYQWVTFPVKGSEKNYMTSLTTTIRQIVKAGLSIHNKLNCVWILESRPSSFRS